MNCGRTVLLLVLACSPMQAAENPFIGNWKENLGKSNYYNQPGVRSAVIRIESAAGKRVKITQEVVSTAGKQTQSVEESALDGSEDQVSPNFVRSFRSISPNVWDRIAKRPGDVRHGYWALSSDGKMLIITGFGKDSDGKDYYFHRVLERQ